MAGKYELDLKAHLNSADLQKQIKAISKSQKIEITADGSKVIKETAKWSEGNNKIIKQVQTIDAETGKVTGTLRTVNQSAQKLNQSFGDVVMKVSKFLLATTVISGFTTAIYGAVDAVKDFDDALTDFKKVSDLDGEALDDYGKKLGQLGLDVARSRTEMVNASAEFKKSGYSDEDSAILSKVASEFQNVADSELSAGESASFIISQMKAFNITATEAEDIIDKVNIVSNNFSVSSTDISSGLTKSSASLATYGNTIEETIGMISAGTEIMTGQSGKVSRGLRSIGANIVNMAKEAKSFKINVGDTKKTIDLFDESTGEMRSTYDVLKDISSYWDEMSRAQQSALGIQLAGKQCVLLVQIKLLEVLKGFNTKLMIVIS